MNPSVALLAWSTAVVLWAVSAGPILADETGLRGHEWTFDRDAASGLAHAPETLRSPIHFRVVGALWEEPAAPLEVRVRPDGGAWAPWTDLVPEDDLAVPIAGTVASRLVFVEEAVELQVRAAPGIVPGAVRIVAIDPGVGTVQNRESASYVVTAGAAPPPQPSPARGEGALASPLAGEAGPRSGAGEGAYPRGTSPAIHSPGMIQSAGLVPIPAGRAAAQIVAPPPPSPEPPPGGAPARPTLSPPPVSPRTTPTPTATPQRVAQPRIVSRAEWGADPSYMTWSPEYVPVRKLILHHTVTSDGGADPGAAIRAIYYYHAVTLGWGDIGYSYIIDRSGTVYEGRAGGANAVAAHAGRYSEGSDGIALLGTFHETRPPEPMLGALAQLIAWRARTQGVDPSGSAVFLERALPNVFGHRDVMSTECPGDAAYALLPSVRQRAAALIYGPPRRASVRVGAVRVSPVSLSSSDTLRVDVTLTNAGQEPITTQGPEPGTIYGQGETYLSRGFPEELGRIRIAAEVDGGVQPDRRFRWGLGSPLGPGETRTVSGFIRFDDPGLHAVRIGVVQEEMDWLQDNLGQTSVRVHPPGASTYLVATPSAELYFPLAMRDVNGWTTRLLLSNPSARPAGGMLTLTDTSGRTSATQSVGLPPRGAAVFDLASASTLGASYVGAASVRFDAPVTGVAFHEREGSDRMAVEPYSAGSARLYAPLVARRYHGLSSGIQVQNLGSTAAAVSVTYLEGSGATWTETSQIEPLASVTFYAPAHAQLPEGFVGSAIVESAEGQPLAAQVNLVRVDGSASAYAAQTAGSSSSAVPLLYRHRNGWESGLQVQDVASTAATVSLTFTPVNGPGGPWQQQATIGHALAATVYLPAIADLPDDLVASAMVQSTGGQSLVLLANSVNDQKRVASSVGGLDQWASTVYVPWVTNDVAGWRTGVQVQNRAAQVVPVSLVFYDHQGLAITGQDDVIPPLSARTYYLPSIQSLPSGFAGSLVVTGRGSAQLSAVVNDVR